MGHTTCALDYECGEQAVRKLYLNVALTVVKRPFLGAGPGPNVCIMGPAVIKGTFNTLVSQAQADLQSMRRQHQNFPKFSKINADNRCLASQ